MKRSIAAFAGLSSGFAAYFVYHQNKSSSSASLLDPSNASFGQAQVLSNQQVTGDTHRIRISLNSRQSLPRDYVFHFYMAEPTSNAFRSFTPVEWQLNDKNYMDVLVKRYPYPLGDVARHLCSLKVGDSLKLHGPHSTFDLKRLDGVDQIGMITGGTGISTMLQMISLLRTRFRDLERPMPKISLLYGSRSPQDILLKDQLDSLKSENVDIVYFVDKGSGNDVKSGYIGPEDIKQHFPSSDSNEKFMLFVCGNPAMMRSFCGDKLNENDQGPLLGTLKTLGYKSHQVYKF